MRHLLALGIKFVACLAVLSLLLGGVYGMSFGDILLITLVLGVVSYIVGDMFILPRTSNTVATMADVGLALVVIWAMSHMLTPADDLFLNSLVAAIAIGVVEFLFHKFVARSDANHAQKDQYFMPRSVQYQTEASEELAPVRPDVRTDESDSKS